MVLTDEEFAAAEQAGRTRREATPAAVGARYDHSSGRVVVRLSSGLEIAFPPSDAQNLEGARPDELEPIEISPSGLGLYFPKLDADLYLPALLDGYLGSARWAASRMGEAGGRARSDAKKAASSANGKLGGRPRKVTEVR